jgi:hypothetical protein
MPLHAATTVDGSDRKQLERVCRYLLRPPFAHDAVVALPTAACASSSRPPGAAGPPTPTCRRTGSSPACAPSCRPRMFTRRGTSVCSQIATTFVLASSLRLGSLRPGSSSPSTSPAPTRRTVSRDGVMDPRRPSTCFGRRGHERVARWCIFGGDLRSPLGATGPARRRSARSAWRPVPARSAAGSAAAGSYWRLV